MKTCKYGHPRGTGPDCKSCQSSNRLKARWQQPSPQMVAASKANRLKSNTNGLNNAIAAQKRALYFKSQTHKDKASAQAKKLTAERHQGIRPPAARTTTDTKLEVATQIALDQLNIAYSKQYPIGPYRFDLFLPEYSTLLEVDGEWAHSQPASIANDLAKDSYVRNQHPELRLMRLPEELVRQPSALIQRLSELTGCDRTITVDPENVQVESVAAETALPFLASHGYLPRLRRDTRAIHGIRHGGDLVGALIYTNASGYHLGGQPKHCLELSRALLVPGYESLLMRAISLSLPILPVECKILISRQELDGWVAEHGYWCLKLGDLPTKKQAVFKTVTVVCGKCGETCSVSKEAARKAIRKHGEYYHHSCRMEMIWTKGVYINKARRSNINRDERVLAVCGCGKSAEIKKTTLQDAIRNHGIYRCISCGVKASYAIKSASREQSARCNQAGPESGSN